MLNFIQVRENARNGKSMNNQLPGLKHQVISENIILLVDTREKKTRYVGLICQIPFGYGYMLCPWVRKRLHFTLTNPNNPRVKIPFPRHFKTTSRAWNWCKHQATGWKIPSRYTIFNPLIKILGVHGAGIYAFFQESKLHLAMTQFIIAILSFLYPTSSINAAIATKATAAFMLIFGIINLLILIHDRKSGQRGGNRSHDY